MEKENKYKPRVILPPGGIDYDAYAKAAADFFDAVNEERIRKELEQQRNGAS